MTGTNELENLTAVAINLCDKISNAEEQEPEIARIFPELEALKQNLADLIEHCIDQTVLMRDN